MGKAIITVQMSADAGIGPGLEWFEGGDQEERGEEELRLADAMLLGRKTYESLSAIWLNTTGEFAGRVNAMPKYVVSRTLAGSLTWNATLLEGDLAEEVRRLKADHAGNLLSYGCGELAFELVRHGLADEVHFWVHPVVWGERSRPFHGLGRLRMRLKESTVFRNGVTLQNYEPISVEPMSAQAGR
ncbi:MAG TPA: dihydrofolate reductase family protein [Nocardioides sp.]|nr:dihydrofolate reductase family protein [Nocardioides sp.]